MERLAGIDAAFLYLETPSAHMHVTGTIVLEPAHDGERARGVEEIADLVATRIAELPLFRKRVAQVPLGLAHPVWVDHPTFEPREHLRQATAPTPGSLAELARVVGRIASRPLDRERPLWEMWAIDGLEQGRTALVTKIHHALLDGVAGARVMANLFDLEPNPQRPATTPAPAAGPAPTASQLLGAALASLSVQPLRLARTVLETGKALLPLVGTALDGASVRRRLPTLPFTAPRTILSGSISPERAVAFGRAELAEVRQIKNAFATTVNDVVLAACTQALRAYLIERDALPNRPLVATIPVSLDPSAGERQGGNRVSAMFVALPVQIADPVIQLLQIARDSRRAKRLHRAIGGDMLGDWIQHAPAAIFSQAAKLYSRFRLADRMPPIHSLVISNVPGPPMPLFAGGARVVATYPLGPVLEGAAVNITVLSYQGSVDMGVIACRETVPDAWVIAAGFERAVTRLGEIARVETDWKPESNRCA